MQGVDQGLDIHGELPHPLEQEDLEALVRSWCEGDTAAKDEIIKHHMRLVVYLVRHYAARAPHLLDELLSVGLLTLCQTVTRFPKVAKNYNINPYIFKALNRAIYREMQTNCGITIPRRTINHKIKNGTVDELDLSIQNPVELQGDTALPYNKWIRLQHRTSHVRTIEINEIVNLSVKTEEEAFIFQSIIEGMNDREIAEQLGRSNTYVWNRRQKIFTTFEYYWSL